MILYNLTVIVEEDSFSASLSYIQESYIPSVMNTNLFSSSHLLKVLDSPNPGVTYCVQFIAEELKQYNEFQDKYESKLMDEHFKKFENKFVSFTTIMEYI